MKNIIYLDHNASTPIHKKVFDEMVVYLTDKFGNPSCGHPYGWDAKEAIEEARQKVASLLSCSSDEIIFTSGGTESNNLAILGTASREKKPGKIITSVIEHPATLLPCAMLEKAGWKIARVGVDKYGCILMDEMAREIDERTTLVTVMHSNNETGTIQPIEEIKELTQKFSVRLHVDAAQSVGKVSIDVGELAADLLSVAGHKLYAPKGVGALYIKKNTHLNNVLFGASQERGIKPGTQNVASIVALGAACEIAEQTMEKELLRVRNLRDELWNLLKDEVPGLELNGHVAKRLPNTLNVRFPEVRGSVLLSKCDEIAASTGSACHEGGEETPSAVLTAMGISHDQALGAVRLTLGRSTKPEQIIRAAKTLIGVFNAMKP